MSLDSQSPAAPYESSSLATARNDGEREVIYGLINVLHAIDTTRNSSSRAEVSRGMTIPLRIVCEEESRDLPEK